MIRLNARVDEVRSPESVLEAYPASEEKEKIHGNRNEVKLHTK